MYDQIRVLNSHDSEGGIVTSEPLFATCCVAPRSQEHCLRRPSTEPCLPSDIQWLGVSIWGSTWGECFNQQWECGVNGYDKKNAHKLFRCTHGQCHQDISSKKLLFNQGNFQHQPDCLQAVLSLQSDALVLVSSSSVYGSYCWSLSRSKFCRFILSQILSLILMVKPLMPASPMFL